MILPTRRAIYALAAASPLLLLGYFTPYAVDLVVSVDALIIILAALDGFLSPSRKHVDARIVGAEAFSKGREAIIDRVWTNSSSRTADLTLKEFRPNILGGLQPEDAVSVGPGETVRQKLLIKPIARGEAVNGWLAVRSSGQMGLAMRQWREEVVWDRPVFPTIPVTRLKAAFGEMLRRRQAGIHEVHRRGDGRLFESLRDWVPGDDTRWIDWKASAKHRKLVSRRYEDERRQQVMILLDAGRLSTAELEGESRFEYAITAALTLALVAARYDDDVGLMIFSDEIHAYVPARRGKRAIAAVTRTLARATPRLTEPDYAAAFAYLASRNRKRAMAVLFTDVIDRGASAALVAASGSLARRHLPVAVALRNPGLEAAAETPLAEPIDAYRRAAAEEMLLSRFEALNTMRRSGVLVLNVQPDDAAGQASSTYIELKKSGRF